MPLKTMSQGPLTLVIQDGEVVRTDKKEKFKVVFTEWENSRELLAISSGLLDPHFIFHRSEGCGGKLRAKSTCLAISNCVLQALPSPG